MPAFTPNRRASAHLWLVLISRPAEGRRLSWPGWLGAVLKLFKCSNGILLVELYLYSDYARDFIGKQDE